MMVNILDNCLNYALQSGASDVVLADGYVPSVRIAGSLSPVPEMGKMAFGDLESMLGSLEGECGVFCGGPWQNVEWRVRYSREAFGKMAVLRPIGAESPNLKSLNAPASVQSLVGCESGLVLFAGPSCCGKTTTASAYVSEVCNSRVLRASFLDALPEYKLYSGESLVRQRRARVPLSEEISQCVRSGSDLLWLGDLPCGESCIPMLRAAESGALVVGVLGAGSADDALTYLLAQENAENRELARVLLSANLKAIVSQRLLLSADKKSFVPAWEVVYNDVNIAALIESGEYYKIPQAMSSAVSDGSLTLDDSLLSLVQSQKITKEEARLHAVDSSLFLD